MPQMSEHSLSLFYLFLFPLPYPFLKKHMKVFKTQNLTLYFFPGIWYAWTCSSVCQGFLHLLGTEALNFPHALWWPGIMWLWLRSECWKEALSFYALFSFSSFTNHIWVESSFMHLGFRVSAMSTAPAPTTWLEVETKCCCLHAPQFGDCLSRKHHIA